MKKAEGETVEMSEEELFRIYSKHEWGEVMSFRKFAAMCESNGIAVVHKECEDSEWPV